MRTYDFIKIKNFIDENKSNIQEVDIGMAEDWFWTGQDVFNNGKYIINLLSENVILNGAEKSSWATPSMLVNI